MRTLRVFSLLLWLFCFCVVSARLSAAQPAEEPAVIEVFNRPVFVARASIMGRDPSTRAKGSMARIQGFIDQGIYGPVTIETRAEGKVIMVGGHPAFLIQSGDVDPIMERTLDETAEEAAKLLTAALADVQHLSSPAYLMKVGVKSAVATLACAGLAWLALALHRKMRPLVERLTKRGADFFMTCGFLVAAQLMMGVRGIFQLVLWLVQLAIVTEWLMLCLNWFPYTQPWGEALRANLADVFGGLFRASFAALPDLIVIGVIIALTRGVQVLVKGFFSGVEGGKVRLGWMNVEAARATRRIVTGVLWLFAIVMIYPYIPGSSSDAFKGMSVFVGVLFSLGSSSVVGQFTSGLVMMYTEALRPGEYVGIGEHEGTVESLGFLCTKLRSPKNEEFHLPNTVILATTIKNYSRLAERGGLLVYTTVTIGYDAPWRQVHAMLIEAAKKTPGLLPAPAPFVLQKSLSDFYVEYQINACLEKPEMRNRVLAALHANIQDEFNTYGVQIMSPHFEQDKARPVVVPKEKWFAAPAAR